MVTVQVQNNSRSVVGDFSSIIIVNHAATLNNALNIIMNNTLVTTNSAVNSLLGAVSSKTTVTVK